MEPLRHHSGIATSAPYPAQSLMRFLSKCRQTLLACSALAAAQPLAAGETRLNEIQAIGSHNSYHQAPPPAVMAVIGRFHPGAEAWNYTHPSLTRQLAESGIRQFELDTFADPEGGLFSSPFALRLAALSGDELPPFDPDGHLAKPGFKILHVPDIDCWSNTPSMEAACRELAVWSAANPAHFPLMILVECKDAAHPPLPTQPAAFTRERLLELEQEILRNIPREKILLPDDVRRGKPTLPEALQRHGWPLLSEMRGKFLFALDNTGAILDRYLEDNPALEGRLFFASAPDEKHPAAAWFKCNDPVREFDRIQRLVKAGFLVRTRADVTTPDPAMRERAFASGAQWVSTDHYSGETPEGFRVVFGNGRTVRTNPLNTTEEKEISP